MSEVVSLERDVILGLLKGIDAQDVVVRFTAEYFSAKELRIIYGVIKNYYNQYSEIPDSDIVANELSKDPTLSAESLIKTKMFIDKSKDSKLEETKFRYAFNEVEKSYATRKIKDNMKDAVDLLDKGEPFEAQDLMLTNLIDLSTFGRGVTVIDFVDGLQERVKDLIDKKENPNLLKRHCIPTGIDTLDDELDGGLRKGELGLWLASPEGGKSVSLQNIAINSALAKYKTILFTIEMTPQQTALRLDSALTGIRYKSFRRAEIEDNEIEYWIKSVNGLSRDMLKIVGVPEGCTCRLIEAELKKMSSTFRPDIVLVDYAGIMSPNEGKFSSSMDWQYVGEIVKNLKGLALKLNIPVWSASQLLVGSKEKDNIGFKDIGLARQQISAHADVCIGLIRTSQMIEMDTARLQFVKAREGVTRRFLEVRTDFDRIRILPIEKKEEEGSRNEV